MRQLVAGARRLPAADDEAVALYAAHRLRLVRLAVLLVDDLHTAEDVVQDAFAGFLARRSRLDDPERALAYLRTSVVNGSRDKLRRRRTARAYVPPHEVPLDTTTESALLAEEHRELIAALQTLGDRQREVLVLRYWSGCTEAEISETLGISRGAVKSTASRALDALAKTMEVSR
ncbi:MAG TPA: SigE family RNA polymerase sigma factor [Nocardioidaceae bacterium]|nr:SigE family RNA polymerase sigma factor [Nocardioidaceae bacterium]